MTIARCMTFLLFVGLASSAAGQHGWPIEPADQEHPIANNMGDFWVYKNGNPYQHPGLDILAIPHTEPEAPYAVVTVAGKIFHVNKEDQTGRLNEVQIDGDDGTRYVYGHLAYGTFLGVFADDQWRDVRVEAGTKIAQIYFWGCDYHHLHYELRVGTAKFVNPLADVVPNPDGFPPQIEEIHFANRNLARWSEFVPPSPTAANDPQACTVVKGSVDIVAKLVDRDDAGAPTTMLDAGNVGVYNLRWRVCPESAPNCTAWNDTHTFSEMLTSWTLPANQDTRNQFSSTPNWVTTANECSASIDDAYRIATDKPLLPWDTTAQPDGNYTVSIEATDIAGNKTTRTALACVQNTPSCTTDLMVRDGSTDSGATPYLDSPFWESPDIAVNPTTAFEGSIRETRSNVIDVTVRNQGSCTLPAGGTYRVCLAWSQPSPYIPFPMPAGQTIECRTETITASGWAPGIARKTTFTWQPQSGSVPKGHACLVAWSDVPPDPVQATSSVIEDNNRAQRNVTIIEAPSLLSGIAKTFYVHHADAMSDRSMEIAVRTSEGQPYKGEVRLHVPPTVKMARIIGASLIGAYKQVRPEALCPTDDARCRTPCPDLANTARHGCAAVYGRFDQQRRVQLEGVVVDETSPLLLEVTGDDNVPPGGAVEAHIVEFDTSSGSPESAIGGLTLRFQIPARP